jgi:hypothetical protein
MAKSYSALGATAQTGSGHILFAALAVAGLCGENALGTARDGERSVQAAVADRRLTGPEPRRSRALVQDAAAPPSLQKRNGQAEICRAGYACARLPICVVSARAYGGLAEGAQFPAR